MDFNVSFEVLLKECVKKLYDNFSFKIPDSYYVTIHKNVIFDDILKVLKGITSFYPYIENDYDEYEDAVYVKLGDRIANILSFNIPQIAKEQKNEINYQIYKWLVDECFNWFRYNLIHNKILEKTTNLPPPLICICLEYAIKKTI